MLNNIKKISIITTLLILLATGLLYFVVKNESAKITTFKECVKAGWLIRGITVYNNLGHIEIKCALWSGKSFEEKELADKPTSSNFGDDQLEKAITDYLLTQKYFSWKTTTDSRNFCVIENLSPTENGLFPLYVWVRCGEFILQDGKLKELSGKSAPAKINYPNQLSFYNLNKFSYEVPGDGSLYLKDVKTIFPLTAQKMIFGFDIANLNKKIESIALSGFK